MSHLKVALKKGDRLVIGNNVVVTVAKVTRGKVVLDTNAPPDIPVNRGDTYDSKIADGEHVPSVIRDNTTNVLPAQSLGDTFRKPVLKENEQTAMLRDHGAFHPGGIPHVVEAAQHLRTKLSNHIQPLVPDGSTNTIPLQSLGDKHRGRAKQDANATTADATERQR